MLKTYYSKETEEKMKTMFEGLNEKDRRLYAGIEAEKLPHGGIRYLSKVLGCSDNTIQQGLKEISDPSLVPTKRLRREGGGRKKTVEKLDGLNTAFLEVLKEHTAGDPMDEKIIWTDLTPLEISQHLIKKGFQVGKYVIKQLLKEYGYVKRKASKSESIGSSENRDEQFLNITRLKAEYQASGNPVISIDTKKKNGWETFIEKESCTLKND
jgi:hypothetical protein